MPYKITLTLRSVLDETPEPVKEKAMNELLNIEKLRPICPKEVPHLHGLFDLVKECWAEEGVFRPDSRQIYNRIKGDIIDI